MKIDVAKITGYAEMSADDKIKALEGYTHDMTGYCTKDVFDKKASEASEYSKQMKELQEQLKGKMTPEEAKALAEAQFKAENESQIKQLQDEINTFKTEKIQAQNTAYAISKLGLTDKECEEMPIGINHEEFKKIVDSIVKSQERQKKELKEQSLDKNMGAGNLPNGDNDKNKKTESAFVSFQKNRQGNSEKIELKRK